MKNKITKKAFKDIFEGILGAARSETLAKYPDLIKSFEQFESPEDFDITFRYPINQVVDQVVMNKFPNIKIKDGLYAISFLYMNYQFIDLNFTRLIKDHEGMACSADKSRYIINALVKFYVTGEAINLKEETGKEYWLPKFLTSEQWVELFDALHSFYFGNVEKYYKFLLNTLMPLSVGAESLKGGE